MKFSGKVTGWAVIDGKAIPVVFELSVKVGKTDQSGLKINGTTIAEIGDRNVTFDLQGFARGNHVSLKGITSEFDSVVFNSMATLHQ